MVLKMKELENKESGFKSLGVESGDNKKVYMAYAQQLIKALEPLIEDLENRSLSEKQEKVLEEVEADLRDKKYDDAF